MPRLHMPHMSAPLSNCQGCQHPLTGRIIDELIDEMGIEQDVIFVGGVGCHAMVPVFTNVDGVTPAAAHGRACDVSTGIKRVLGSEVQVINLQGDGDAMAIGIEPTIQAAARGERITVIMANNTNYGTTGGQMAPTTVPGQITTTTPFGRSGEEAGYPINAAEMMASIKGVAYSARGSFTSPDNWLRTKGYVRTAIRKQMDDVGFSFVEILVACPTNWGKTPLDAIEWIEDAVTSQFPLGVFKNVDKIE
ncbi:MAG: 2-oxoglutarate oxidoreductase [Dehalococcoidia bacterium]|nr:2-oxoglutarate oxidoreductase [Dehalococcoidia bacterium]